MNLEAKVEVLKQIGAEALVDQTLNKIIQSKLHQLTEAQVHLRQELDEFEQRYGMSSEECWKRFEAGTLGDNTDYFEWTGIYEVYRSNEMALQRLKADFK